MVQFPAIQPTLATKRLLLRPFLINDATEVQLYAGDLTIADTTLNIPHPYEDGMAEEWITSHAPQFSSGSAAIFAIVRQEGDQLVGAIGLSVRQDHARAELGYWIGRPFWGEGYCTEAAQAVMDFAFRVLHLHRVHATHFARNTASGRIMQKLGMQREGVCREHLRKWDKPEDEVHYGILAAEWVKQISAVEK